MKTVVWGSSLGMYLHRIGLSGFLGINSPKELYIVPVPLDAVDAGVPMSGTVQVNVAGQLHRVPHLHHGGEGRVVVQGHAPDTSNTNLNFLNYNYYNWFHNAYSIFRFMSPWMRQESDQSANDFEQSLSTLDIVKSFILRQGLASKLSPGITIRGFDSRCLWCQVLAFQWTEDRSRPIWGWWRQQGSVMWCVHIRSCTERSTDEMLAAICPLASRPSFWKRAIAVNPWPGEAHY